MSYDIYTGLLKAFPLRNEGKKDIHFSYDNSNLQFTHLRANYPIEAIAGNGGDFAKAINLMRWLSSHIYYKGNFNEPIAHNSLELLNYAYDKGALYGINCVALATILSECLLAIGLKARRVFLMPCSPYDGDFHAVTHVYIREMDKWVMFDPTFNIYFSNKQGEYLSILDLRSYLANQELVIFNDKAKDKENLEYFAKNLFYFQMFERSTFGEGNAIGEGSAPGNRFITLSPQGYDAKQMRLINIEYRIKAYGNSPAVHNWIERVKQDKYSHCSSDDFNE